MYFVCNPPDLPKSRTLNAVGQGVNGGQSPLYESPVRVPYVAIKPLFFSTNLICMYIYYIYLIYIRRCQIKPAPENTNGLSNISEVSTANTPKDSHNASIANMAAKT